MLTDRNVASVRTVAPAIAGAIAAWLVSRGVNIDGPTLLAVGVAAMGVYHRAVLVLESRWPKLGRLLGVAKAPTYTPQPPAA